MEERDPLKQLQHLLDDPGKVLERIFRIQSVLGAIHPPSSTAPAVPSAASLPGEVAITGSEAPERPYAQLLQMLRDLRAHIEERLHPLALLTLQAEVQQLREQIDRVRGELDTCMQRIDRSLEICVHRIADSRSICADLTALNGRLTELGAIPEPVSEFFTLDDPGEIIACRIADLRTKGKIL